jgi:hypothetical protein
VVKRTDRFWTSTTRLEDRIRGLEEDSETMGCMVRKVVAVGM